ncbi:c-type cytochrome [Ideonella sp. BN130291]|uniref:c-type cytochrome n=1 Tax=Ideonella sp. BN130291 TaxID=3112940 RepID=UPI002E255F74|nr:cytochrome c [Ideonella sp. BN130291]
MRPARALLALMLAACTGAAPAAGQPASAPADAAQGALLPRDSTDAAVFRGGLVFANYCVTCHGINADGNGRAARLYDPRPANLRMSDKNDAYMGLIIRMGGEALGRSQFMPPWGAELTDEQMKDIVAYLRSINVRPRD